MDSMMSADVAEWSGVECLAAAADITARTRAAQSTGVMSTPPGGHCCRPTAVIEPVYFDDDITTIADSYQQRPTCVRTYIAYFLTASQAHFIEHTALSSF